MGDAMRVSRSVPLLALVLLVGCVGQQVHLPDGTLPPPASAVADQQSAALIGDTPPVTELPRPPGKGFELPPGLPGADAPPIVPPKLPRDTPAAERAAAIAKAFPALPPLAGPTTAAGEPLALPALQALAFANSPVLRKATAQADAAHGAFIQAGLYPNPTVGYQVDQWQPFLREPLRNNGQQGMFVNYLVKTCGKVPLAQMVAGFDYLNALVEKRRAEIDLANRVRTHYFAVLVAREGVRVNRHLIELADEVYALQLKQLAAGQAAGYEPLQLYAQAVQARNALAASEATALASWRQLAATLGQPGMPPAPLAGRAEAPPPCYDLDALRARMQGQHTDLAQARNTLGQAEVSLTLQQRIPKPDLQTNSYYQYDTLARGFQFGVQLGVTLPLADRNQGNIRQAEANIVRARENIEATRNDLESRLAEAFGRFTGARIAAANQRDAVLPNLVRAYRGIIQRYQVEPDKVGFNDIVVAQQNLASALQAYLSSLDAQWKAAVDVASAVQLEELFPAEAARP